MPEEKLASRWLVSTDWLAAHLADPNVVVLDGSYYLANAQARRRRPSSSPAIFRARSASTSTRSRTSPIPCPTCCRRPEQFAAQVGALGVGDGMTIVLYDGIGLYGAARVWWTFRAFGVRERARARWRHAEVEGRRTARSKPARPSPARRRPSRRNSTARWSPRSTTCRRCCSTRPRRSSMRAPADRFRGEAPEPRAGLRGGHMPGSFNVPFGEVLKDGRLKSPEEIAAAFKRRGSRPRQADGHELRLGRDRLDPDVRASTRSASSRTASTTAPGPNGARGRIRRWSRDDGAARATPRGSTAFLSLRSGVIRPASCSEAEQLYRSILEIDPRQLDCLHFLGMIALQDRPAGAGRRR